MPWILRTNLSLVKDTPAVFATYSKSTIIIFHGTNSIYMTCTEYQLFFDIESSCFAYIYIFYLLNIKKNTNQTAKLPKFGRKITLSPTGFDFTSLGFLGAFLTSIISTSSV